MSAHFNMGSWVTAITIDQYVCFEGLKLPKYDVIIIWNDSYANYSIDHGAGKAILILQRPNQSQ